MSLCDKRINKNKEKYKRLKILIRTFKIFLFVGFANIMSNLKVYINSIKKV
jgi:hypothetical protein